MKRLIAIATGIIVLFIILIITFRLYVGSKRNLDEYTINKMYDDIYFNTPTNESKDQLYDKIAIQSLWLYHCKNEILFLEEAKEFIEKGIKENRVNPSLYRDAAMICLTLSKAKVACNPNSYLAIGESYLTNNNLYDIIIYRELYNEIGETKKANELRVMILNIYDRLDPKDKSRYKEIIDKIR